MKTQSATLQNDATVRETRISDLRAKIRCYVCGGNGHITDKSTLCPIGTSAALSSLEQALVKNENSRILKTIWQIEQRYASNINCPEKYEKEKAKQREHYAANNKNTLTPQKHSADVQGTALVSTYKIIVTPGWWK